MDCFYDEAKASKYIFATMSGNILSCKETALDAGCNINIGGSKAIPISSFWAVTTVRTLAISFPLLSYKN